MTTKEKKKKAAMIAVAYYLEEEAAKQNEDAKVNSWSAAGKKVMMGNRTLVQRRGRLLPS